MNKLAFFFSLAIVIISFGACHNHEEDANAPVVTVESPAENAVITGAVNLHIVVTDESLHEMEVKVTKDSDGSELFSATPTVHDETDYHFEQSFTPASLSGETAVTLTITVEDHSSNVTTKTVKFTVKP